MQSSVHNPPPESRYEVLGIFTGTMVAASLFMAATGAVLPFLTKAFGLVEAQAGLVLSVQVAGSVVMTAVAGMLTDRFGDKAVVRWSGLFMGVALCVASLVHNFTWLLAWLMLYGVGFASVTPAGSHAIVYFFNVKERGMAMGIRQCGFPIAGFLGCLLLPAAAERFHYQGALVIAGVVTIGASFLASTLYREPIELQGERVSVRVLFRGMALMARNERLILLTLSSMALASVQYAVSAFLAVTLVRETGVVLTVAVGMFAISQLTGIAGRLTWGWSIEKIFGGSRSLPLVVVAAMTAVLCLLLSNLTPLVPLWETIVLVALLGFSAVGWFGVALLAIAEIGGAEHAGSALGVSLTGVFFAAAVTPFVFGAITDAYGYTFAWRTLALLACVGVVPALLIHSGSATKLQTD